MILTNKNTGSHDSSVTREGGYANLADKSRPVFTVDEDYNSPYLGLSSTNVWCGEYPSLDTILCVSRFSNI
jgi:hypothetical protein